MPPSVSVPLAAAFLGLFVLIGGAGWGVAAFSGFIAGYLAYDMLHYHTHHHVPRTRLGRKLRELHMRHHFQDHTTGYGVSAPYWDHVFGTAPKQRAK
jgi:sterol desaturase/sphingolipid hydroxylase (fatty acid hydroxylase superfamily)